MVSWKRIKRSPMDIHIIVKLKSSYEAWHELFANDADNPSKICEESKTLVGKADDATALVTLFDVDMAAMEAMAATALKEATVAKDAWAANALKALKEATDEKEEENVSDGEVQVTLTKAKSVGARSILQKAGKLSKSKKEKLLAAIRQRKKGDFGWRTLAVKMSETLNVEVRGHETARRTPILLTARSSTESTPVSPLPT